jgi:hypothetical protein
VAEAVPARGRAGRGAAFVACVALALLVLGYLHDRQWNAYDDGAYLHVADRMLHGEVLNRDVQDVHAGYVNFANAAAMWLFGNDAVSPRYPLVAMGLVNAAVAFWLLAPYGTLPSVAGSVAATCLSCTQFMNPTAHWYALFLTLLTLLVMTRRPPTTWGTHLLLGLLVGFIFLFRQLTGVFAGAAVLLCLLLHLPQVGRGKQTWPGRAFIALMAVVLGVYFARNVDAAAAVMYCAWPALLLLWGVWNCAAPAKAVTRMLATFTAGFVAAAIPLVLYHVRHGSVHAWLDDTFFDALSLTSLPFIDQYRYWRSMVGGARAATHPRDVIRAATGLFWLLALVLPVLHGLLAVRTLWRRGRATTANAAQTLPAAFSPAPMMALFYFPVALHLQKYMYFFFAAPVLIVGLLAIAPAAVPGFGRFRTTLAAGVLGLSLTALVCMSGGTLLPGSRRVHLTRPHSVPRCGVRLEEDVARLYGDILTLVDRETDGRDAIFALPVHPELYYLTNRRNPTRFYNTALALHSESDTRILLEGFGRSPPKLVFYNPRNAYNTAESSRIMDWVRSHYDRIGTVGAFEIYRFRPDAA